MAHIWFRSDPDDGGDWSRLAIESGLSLTFPLESGAGTRHPTTDPGQAPVGKPIEIRRESQGDWVLISPPGSQLRVNGLPVPGIRVLGDRDELLFDGHTAFFSTERLARVEPFPGQTADTRCPRCKTEIAIGTPAVCCPGCDVWYHEDPENESACWTYGSECMLCGHPTALDGEWQWTPEAL